MSHLRDIGWVAVRQLRPSADTVRGMTGAMAVPVPVDTIALRLGVKLVSTQIDQISGYVDADPGNGAACVGVADEARQRQRYTIALMLGYLVTGRSHAPFRRTRGVVDVVRDQEDERAYAFAADLLMPVGYLSAAISVGGYNVSALAATFDVSTAAVANRLSIRRGRPTL